MKLRFWSWVRKNILHISDGEMSPKWCTPFIWVLFPIMSIRSHPTADPRWEPWNDTFLIFGQRYSGQFFRSFSEDLQEGQKFRFLSREKNGPVRVEKLEG